MGTGTETVVEDFLSRFPENLRGDGRNEYLPPKHDHAIELYSVQNCSMEDAKFYDIEQVPDAGRYPFLDGRGRRTFVVGGGKSLEFFDFDRLGSILKPDDLVIGVNSGACFCEADVVFFSGGVSLRLPDEYGGGAVSVNGGLYDQYRHAHADKPQLVVIPFSYRTDHQANAGTVAKVEEDFRTSVMNVEYTDLWATKGKQPTFDAFCKAVSKRRLYGMGADFGMMAICCALMWGARDLNLIGFDGRFIDTNAVRLGMNSEEFFASMWAGDQSLYADQHEEALTRQQCDYLVAARNQINEALFGYLRRYCKQDGVGLHFLTPSIHAEEAEYLKL